MGAISVRLPDSLHAKLREYADRDSSSINQFVALAGAERIKRLEAETFFEQRLARRVGRDRYLRLLAKAPDVEPDHLADAVP